MKENSVDNVVLLVVDALRRDFVSAYTNNSPRPWDREHPTDLTPNIDTLAAAGERFDNTFSCINQTDPSMTSIRSGQYPARHGVRHHGRDISEEEQRYAAGAQSLPAMLDDHKTLAVETTGRYHKKGFNSYRDPNKEDRPDYVDTGIDLLHMLPAVVEDRIKPTLKHIYVEYILDTGVGGGRKSHSAYPDAERMTDKFLDSLDSIEKPFFSLVHYWDTHIPYTSTDRPETAADVDFDFYDDGKTLQEVMDEINSMAGLSPGLADLADTVGDAEARVAAGARLVDEQIGRIVDELERRGLLEDTAIIVTSDHGESIDEHGIYFSHHTLYDQTTHVPLIIQAPGFSGKESRFVQHVDLAPTILDLLGEKYDPRQFDGQSLVPDENGARSLDRDEVLLEERWGEAKQALRTSDWKYIRRVEDRECYICGRVHGGPRELYDLTADPLESENLEETRPHQAEQLNDQLSIKLDSLPDPSGSSLRGDEMDEEYLKHLDALGYIS